MRERPPFELVRAWAEQRFPDASWPWAPGAARRPAGAPHPHRHGRPTTRVAAGASVALLALGIVIGAATGPGPQPTYAAQDPLIVVGPPAGVPAAVAPLGPVPAVAAPVVEPETAAADPVASVPATEAAAVAVPAPAPTPPAAEPAPAAPESEEPAPDDGSEPTEEPARPPGPARPTLPAVGRTFIVWMADGRSERTFSADSPLPYVATTLAAQGLTLPRYHGVAHGTVGNGVALLGGLVPTAAQRAGCAQPALVAPAGPAPDGQVTGDGCVLPDEVPNLLGQLTGAGRTWKVYAGDLSATGVDTCRAPALGAPDPATRAPRPGDAFATARVPALWFASITASPDCGNVVDLAQLDRDLAAPDQLPDVSLIVPGACDAGAELVCPDGRPSGPAAANAFLRALVPKLTGTDAHARDGLVVVTWDQAPETGPFADARACCSTRPGFPAGGGRTGAVLLSPFVQPGTVVTKPYDHYALLRSLQDLYGLDRLGLAATAGVQGFGPNVLAAR